MTGHDLLAERLNPDCIAVLGSYSIREITARSENPDYGGWLNRVDEVTGVDSAALTGIHGLLIAQGMLKFEITGRSVGLQYQVSPLGREALARYAATAAGESADLHDGSDSVADESLEQDSTRHHESRDEYGTDDRVSRAA